MTGRWWPALLVGLVVVTLSLVPLGGGGVASGGVAGVGADKLLHLLDYAALAFALGYAVRARTAKTLLTVFLTAVAVGGAVELLQGPLPTRATSLADAAANTVGAALGTAGWWLLVAVRANRD